MTPQEILEELYDADVLVDVAYKKLLSISDSSSTVNDICIRLLTVKVLIDIAKRELDP